MQGYSAAQKEDLLVGLATLAINDGGVELSADNINALISASGNTVQSFWGGLFAKILAGQDLDSIIMKPGVGGGGAAPAGAAPTAGGAAKAAEVKKEESSSEESVGGAGGGLFGEEEDW